MFVIEYPCNLQGLKYIHTPNKFLRYYAVFLCPKPQSFAFQKQGLQHPFMFLEFQPMTLLQYFSITFMSKTILTHDISASFHWLKSQRANSCPCHLNRKKKKRADFHVVSGVSQQILELSKHLALNIWTGKLIIFIKWEEYRSYLKEIGAGFLWKRRGPWQPSWILVKDVHYSTQIHLKKSIRKASEFHIPNLVCRCMKRLIRSCWWDRKTSF